MYNYLKTVEKLVENILKYFSIGFKRLLTTILFFCTLRGIYINRLKEILLINSDKMTTS